MHFTTVASLEKKRIAGHGGSKRGPGFIRPPSKNGFATAAFTVKCKRQWR